MSEPLQGITITSREIYDAVVRLTGRVDVLIEQQTQTRGEIQELKADFRDHEERLRGLEKNRWPMHLVTALLAAAALVVSILQN